MNQNNEFGSFGMMIEVLDRVITEGHANVMQLRERANRDLGMHVAMKLVETEVQRSTRRFQLEEHMEAVIKFNVTMREKIARTLEDFKLLVQVGEAIGPTPSESVKTDLTELRAAIRKLQQVSAELDYVELGVSDVQSKIQAMV